MKKALVFIPLVLTGYILGSVFPLENLLEPQRRVRFTADYLIKAGTEAKQRRSFIMDLIYPVEIDFFKSNPHPQLQLVDR